MKQHTKDVIQYGSAVAMIVTGIVLAIASFIWLKLIHQSVLMYVGEAVGFASAVFGLTVYSTSKIRESRDLMQEDFEALKRDLLNRKTDNHNSDEALHNK